MISIFMASSLATQESLIILFPDERPLAYLLAEHPQKKAARFISVTFRQNVEITTYNAILVLERAHISLNSSFIELQNFEFEHIASLSFFHFSSLRSSLETSFPSFGPNTLSISSFIKFEFALNTNH